jgi:ABC-type multidrug transport system ATPase subunit
MSIIIKNLTISIAGNSIINKLDLHVEGKETPIVLITGSVGCGKTTLLKVLSGIAQTLYKGTIYVNGYIKLDGLTPLEALEKGIISYIPQEPYAFFIGSSVDEELTLSDKEIVSLYSYMINDLKGKLITNLSAGEMYRLLAITSITHNTRFVVFDEPSSYLDIELLEEFLRLTKRLAEELKLSIIIADHDPFMFNLADRIVDLDKFRDPNIVSNPTDSTDISYLGNMYKSCINEYILRKVREAHLRAERLGYKINDRWIIKDVSINASAGDIICILGPNGSGKTTIMKLIAKIIKPSQGMIDIKGRIFYIPQIPVKWYISSSVLEEIKRFSLCSRDINYSIFTRYFMLERHLLRNPYSLSTGESRRLALLLAFLSHPDILLIDEPYLGLDLKSRHLMKQVIEYLSKQGSITVLASHSKAMKQDFNICSEIIEFSRE